MNQYIIFGPLGWHKNIWNAVFHENDSVLFLEFPLKF
jgi:hypothetical protein